MKSMYTSFPGRPFNMSVRTEGSHRSLNKFRGVLQFRDVFLSMCCCMMIAGTASASGHASHEASLELVSVYDVKDVGKKTEIVSIQATTQRMALSCSTQGIVEIISITSPESPKALRRFKVTDGEEISSVAFHPTANFFAVAVVNRDLFAAGKVQVHDADSGKLLKTFAVGVHPDSAVFSPNGKYLVVANEGEAYRYNNKRYESPEGSITHVFFGNDLQDASVTQIPLSDYSDVAGMLHKSHARALERKVGDGNSDEEIEIPLRDNSPANSEPEFVAFSPDSTRAFVSLQENNGVVVIDTASAKIEKVFGLGMTEHLADIKDDDKVQFDKKIRALREPDGISISSDGKFLLTADEGDTDPKAAKVLGGKPVGGGRTLSVFDAGTGEFIADTGNQLDEMAHAAGLYPDGRSDNRGSEPENVVSFHINNKLFAAVGLERANAVALVSLEDPAHPKVVGVTPVDPEAGQGGKFAPEGLAHYQSGDRHYIFSANEKSGSMSVMRVQEQENN